MFLLKKCFSEHNIKTGSKLKLGTLYEYRETERTDLVDHQEGTFTFEVKINGTVTLDRKWHNTLFRGLCVGDDNGVQIPSNTHIHATNYDYIGHSENTVTLRDTLATIEKNEENSFIFCMSLIKEKNEHVNFFQNYNDQWFVAYENFETAGHLIGQSLLLEILLQYKKGTPVIPKEFCNNDLRVRVLANKVTYQPRTISISNNDNMTELQQLLNSLQEVAFTKPSRFKLEQEFRYQFLLLSNGQIVTPTVRELLVDATLIKDLATLFNT
ncbi:hypothetical protein BK669_00565 [Pseudomonas fluorescens]|nr:hypothetical protein BK669_00565 [Pseudomonas fluorescens]